MSQSALNPHASVFTPRTVAPQSSLNPRAKSFVTIKAVSYASRIITSASSGEPARYYGSEIKAIYTKKQDKASANAGVSLVQLVLSGNKVVQGKTQLNKAIVRLGIPTCLCPPQKFKCKLARRLFVPLLIIGAPMQVRVPLASNYKITYHDLARIYSVTTVIYPIFSAIPAYAGLKVSLIETFNESGETENGGKLDGELREVRKTTEEQLMRIGNKSQEAHNPRQSLLTLAIRSKVVYNPVNEESEAMAIFGDKDNEHEIDAGLTTSSRALEETLQTPPRAVCEPFAPFDKPGFGPSARQMEQDLLPKPELAPVQSVSATPTEPFHHCGFWNGLSPFKSETDPAVSLAILTASPKSFMAVSEFDHEPAKHIIAWNAHRLLDPVIYMGDFDIICTKRASERRNMAVGQVFQFYSGYGSWQDDTLSEEDHEPMLDHVDIDYYSANATVVNGYADNKGQPTQYSLDSGMTLAAQNAEQRRKVFQHERESSDGFGPSPLKNAYTPESMAAEEVREAADLLAEQQQSEAIRAHYINRLLRAGEDSDSDCESNYSQDEEPLQQFEDNAKDCTAIEGTFSDETSSSDQSCDSSCDSSAEVSDDDEDEQISPVSPHAIRQALERLTSYKSHTPAKSFHKGTSIPSSSSSEQSPTPRARSTSDPRLSVCAHDSGYSPTG